MVEGKTPVQMPGVLHETFAKTVREARAAPPGIIGPFRVSSLTCHAP